MANSLRAKIKQLRHKGKITQQEYDEIIKKLDGHDTEQLVWWLDYMNKVVDHITEEIEESRSGLEKMKETDVPSLEYIDKTRGYIQGLRTAMDIMMRESKYERPDK